MSLSPADTEESEPYTALILAMEALVSSGLVGGATEGPHRALRDFITSGRSDDDGPVLDRVRFTKGALEMREPKDLVTDVICAVSRTTHSMMKALGESRSRARLQDVVVVLQLWQPGSKACLDELIQAFGLDAGNGVQFVSHT